ncbi:MAG TPA: TrkA family potassium uptake protein [Gaiellaceae bacterium]|nr:TrkA family potassium uptake protein [Gaiellaceae bacterium]
MVESLTARKVAYAVTALLLVLIGGTIAFHQSLDETWIQSVYRTTVTVSLAGLDTVPRNDSARAVSIVLVLAGITIFAYIATVLVEGIARGVFTGAFAERRRRRAIEHLSDHYIICGYGRVGRRAAAEFRQEGVSFVVLDFSEDAIEAAREADVLIVEGTGTEDEDLRAAGLEHARGLVASADSDADNLYITLSARNARPDLLIVARASDEDAAKKLALAGADRVVQPYSTAGKEMAKLVLRPQVAAFLDIVSTSGGPDLLFEEIEVKETCREAGKSIRDLRIREATGAMVVALRKRDGSFDATPAPDAALDVGDVMIAAGTPDELRRLEELFAPAEALA